MARFVYAALELRLGIEARVTEYLEVALKQLGRRVHDVPDHVASTLLRRFRAAAPHAERPSVARLIREWPAKPTQMYYMPVTSARADVHGRLGEAEAGLAGATAGTLLGHWQFTKLVSEGLRKVNASENVPAGRRHLAPEASGLSPAAAELISR